MSTRKAPLSITDRRAAYLNRGPVHVTVDTAVETGADVRVVAKTAKGDVRTYVGKPRGIIGERQTERLTIVTSDGWKSANLYNIISIDIEG